MQFILVCLKKLVLFVLLQKTRARNSSIILPTSKIVA